MTYAATIKRELEERDLADRYDVRHVEAWMRNEVPTLDHITPCNFTALLNSALDCIEDATPATSERLAQSFGL